jgi:hypothetical protein
MGKRVRTHSTIPHNTLTRIVGAKGNRKDATYGNAMAASIPFRKCRASIAEKLIAKLPIKNVVNAWFSCHSNNPCNPHLLHEGISVEVISAVAVTPAMNR